MKMLIGLPDLSGNEPTLRFAEGVAELIEAKTTILHDVSARRILREAELGAYGLLAVRWTGMPRLDRIARQVVAGTKVSVLVIKGELVSLGRLLICTGGRPVAEPIIRTGARLAQAASAEVTLLHVASAVPGMYTGLQAMDEGIEDLLKRDTPEAKHLREGAQIVAEHGVGGVIELRHGVVVDEIIRSAQRWDCDLIVVGASESGSRLNRLFFGRVTQKILELAPCSVLVVRRGWHGEAL
jgi:nucleotide-binding universal stress UspA family protein